MRVFSINTSAGIYLAFWPFSLCGLSPTSSKEECVQTVDLLATPGRQT